MHGVTFFAQFLCRSTIMDSLDVHTKVWPVFRFEAALITLEQIITISVHSFHVKFQGLLRLQNLAANFAKSRRYNLPLLFRDIALSRAHVSLKILY